MTARQWTREEIDADMHGDGWPKDSVFALCQWAADIRRLNGKSVDADRLDAIAAEMGRLRNALRDLALAKPLSECETFRPNASCHEHLGILRAFARRALDADA